MKTNLTAAVVLLGSLVAFGAQAATATSITVTVKNHRFQPAEVHAPAGVPVVLRVKNLDSTPMELESVSLRVEKIVTGKGEGIVRLRALSPGRYNFFDDFHQKADGVLVVR